VVVEILIGHGLSLLVEMLCQDIAGVKEEISGYILQLISMKLDTFNAINHK
jgi:hypothetical protein